MFVGWRYIPGNVKKKAYYNRPGIFFRKNVNSITAESSDIKDNILFNDNP